MFEILMSMIKEEWRIHSTIFSGMKFFLFPFVISLFVFLVSLLFSIFSSIITFNQIALLIHYLFVLFGLSVGAFGLLGREIMNRRFEQASMIAYSSRTLPLSEKRILLNFFIKDIIYYFLLWILPVVVGFAIASPIISVNLNYSFILLTTLTLSFLIGLSISFFLSTIYVHSMKLLIGILSLTIISGVFTNRYFHTNVMELLPSITFFFNPSMNLIIASLAIVVILSSFSIFFFKVDYAEKKRMFKNHFNVLSNIFRFNKYSIFIAKDILDMNRSGGGMGKILFSLLFPLIIIWLMLSIFLKLLPTTNTLIMFSIFLGVMSSSIYNWLTEFDLFTAYSFLPIKTSEVIKGKLNTYVLLNIISLIILIVVALVTSILNYLLPSIASFIMVSFYSLAVTVYLTGLHPNILLYDAKILLAYVLLISPVLLALIFLSVLNPFYLLMSPLLMVLSICLIKKSFKKWDDWEQQSF
ncbi:MAG: hypothetical protein J4428_01555 [Candidatus Aenigmarchaeota archaeon]|nr:hypothetical protein [Candidatus Aenigmarchaeota archaeon]